MYCVDFLRYEMRSLKLIVLLTLCFLGNSPGIAQEMQPLELRTGGGYVPMSVRIMGPQILLDAIQHKRTGPRKSVRVDWGEEQTGLVRRRGPVPDADNEYHMYNKPGTYRIVATIGDVVRCGVMDRPEYHHYQTYTATVTVWPRPLPNAKLGRGQG